MNVRWTPAALQKLAAIERYIEEDNPIAAKRVAEKIFHQADKLKQFPQRGTSVSATTRQLRIPKLPYRLIYTVADRDVLIVTVLHDALREQ